MQKPFGVDISNDACICVILNEYEMRIYDENGNYIKSISSPSGYRHFRFFGVGNDMIVVCQGIRYKGVTERDENEKFRRVNQKKRKIWVILI